MLKDKHAIGRDQLQLRIGMRKNFNLRRDDDQHKVERSGCVTSHMVFKILLSVMYCVSLNNVRGIGPSQRPLPDNTQHGNFFQVHYLLHCQLTIRQGTDGVVK
jgi:hypothetical protein